MKVFLSHTKSDKDIIEPIGSFLTSRGIKVWLDSWCLTAGDSLIGKIGEGIEDSDRLVVFLSPNSVESNWVKKEIATGLIMELAEERGFGEKFVVPALLLPCKIPIMLRDKLYANFTNKAFSAACEELLAGLCNKASGPNNVKLENRICRVHRVPGESEGVVKLVVEFAVRISPTDGLHVGVDVGRPYASVVEWFGPPNNPTPPANSGGVFTDSSTRREPPIFARKFSTPNVTSTKSYYLQFQGDDAFEIKNLQYLDFFGREP